jgi:hypothetical protein
MMRARSRRGESAHDDGEVEDTDPGSDPEHEAVVADSVGPAMLVVLPTLTPAERVAFVLHGLFDLPFEEIAPVVSRTPPAAVAETFAGRARAARPALIGGDIGLVSAPGGTPRVAFAMSFGAGLNRRDRAHRRSREPRTARSGPAPHLAPPRAILVAVTGGTVM